MVDRARVIKVDERTCVEAGCYDGVKVTESPATTRRAPCSTSTTPRVGGVRVGWAGNDPTKETLEWSRSVLDPAALAKVRAAAQAGEGAYQHSKDVWGTTAPARTAPAPTTPALVGAVGPRATGSIACRPCSRCLPWPRACAGAPPTSSRG